MLKKITFSNFKCFEKSELTFRDLTIIVGQNNAGKSSIIEALRLISLAGRIAVNTNQYIAPPKELDLPSSHYGFHLNTKRLKIDPNVLVFYYSEDVPAIITAIFANKSKIVIYIKSGEVFACIIDTEGNNIRTKTKAKHCQFNTISILPQIGLIKEHEKLLDPSTINSDKDSYLTSRHFRNELYLNKSECFSMFKKLAEETWNGLRVDEPEYKFPYEEISLLVRDANFTSEIGLMGSGIQMWLQVVWFICRSSEAETIIFDEPDVYMHPDLQRKILALLKNRFPQIIIATHSVEIITSVEPGSIVAVNKNTRKMKYADDGNAVQNVIDSIGGVHNLALLRITQRRKCVFVEGNDLKLYAKLAQILGREDQCDLQALPCVSLGGFSRLNEAFGAANLFFRESSGQIGTICILDHDYYPEAYLDKLRLDSEKNHLKLHILNKKEIENFFIAPSALFRLSKQPISQEKQFLSEYEKMVDEFKDKVFDRTLGKMLEFYRPDGKDYTTVSALAREYVKSHWTTLDEKIGMVSGKELLSQTNAWMQEQYKKHCSLTSIANILTEEEIDPQIVEILDELQK